MTAKFFRFYRAAIAALCLLSAWTGSVEAQARVERATFPAAGDYESVVQIDAPGRYSIQVHSDQGARLELVDWMAGPIAADGQAGARDGRLDVLLDAGTYKVRLNSHAGGSGDVRQVFRVAGALTLEIPSGHRHLFVAGDAIAGRFLGADGRIRERDGDMQLEPSPGGLLEIAYKPGYVRVWHGAPEQQAFEHIRPAGLTTAFAELPASAFEDGLGVLQDAPQRWDITLSQPQYVVAASDAPGMMALAAQDQVLELSVGSGNAGHRVQYFLPPGEYQLWTRPLRGVAQQGHLRLSAVTPCDLDAAMLKPRLIQAGETQVFGFQVAAAATVGVGVETESDRLSAELRDSDFRLLADGPLMLRDLDAGAYLLIVRTRPPDAAPAQYRPVVYGHAGSDQASPTTC